MTPPKKRAYITVDYGTHQYSDNWVKEADLHCIGCGAKTVWRKDNGGDYYEGEAYMCSACGTHLNIPAMGLAEEDKYRKQEYEQLKKADN